MTKEGVARETGWDGEFLVALAGIARTSEQFELAEDIALAFYERLVEALNLMLFERIVGLVAANVSEPGLTADMRYAAEELAREVYMPLSLGREYLSRLEALQ